MKGPVILLDTSSSMNAPVGTRRRIDKLAESLASVLPSMLLADSVAQTFYCGDESNRAAIAFLRDLALCSRGSVGRMRIGNLAKPEQLAADLRPLLVGPAR